MAGAGDVTTGLATLGANGWVVAVPNNYQGIAAAFGPVLWASRPSAVTSGVGSTLIVSDIGANGPTLWRSDGTDWRPASPIYLHFNVAQVSATVSNTNQLLRVSEAIPRSVMASLRYLSVSHHYSKNGVADVNPTTVNLYMGTAGTSADALMYSTGTFTAASRQFSGGTLLRYNASTLKVQSLIAAANTSLEAAATSTSAFPVSASAVLADVNQFFSWYAFPGATPADTVALERSTIIGY